VQFASFDERSNAGPVLRSLVVTSEERILPIKYNLPVILPTSGRKLRSITAGIRCMDVASGDKAASSANWVGLLTSR
jgi:hypothetical protein